MKGVNKMGKASTKAQNKYISKKYDRINLTVDKGKKETIKSHADKFDSGSVNAFINRAINETMQKDFEKNQSTISQVKGMLTVDKTTTKTMSLTTEEKIEMDLLAFAIKDEKKKAEFIEYYKKIKTQK